MENLDSYKKNSFNFSFIDLFLIFVRYRKFIIFSTLGGIILSVLLFFVLPKISVNGRQEKLSVIYTITERNMPVDLQNYLFENEKRSEKIDVASFCYENICSSAYVAKINKDVPVFGKYNDSEYNYNEKIDKIFNGKDSLFKINFSLIPFTNSIKIRFEIPKENLNLSKNFVDTIFNDLENNLEDYLFPSIENYISNLEKRIAESEKVLVKNMNDSKLYIDYLNDIENLSRVNKFKDSFDSFIYLNEDSFAIAISENNKSLRKSFMLIIFIVMVSLLIAVILNEISNLKRDRNFLEKFDDAWKGGKSK